MPPVYAYTVNHPEHGVYALTAFVREASLEQALGDESATLQLETLQLPHDFTMGDITLSVDGVLRFTGTIKSQTAHRRWGLTSYRLDCVDHTDRLHRRVVNALYSAKTVKTILQEVTLKYASYIDTSLVQDFSEPIEEIRFDYDTLGTVYKKLAYVVGAYWFLDPQNRLHFFNEHEGAGESGFEQSDIADGSLTIESSAQNLVNRIWIVGAKAAAQQYVEQFFTGDGQNAMWPLLFVPNYPEVFEAGATRTIEVDKGFGGTSDKNYVYDKKNKILRRVAGPAPNGVQIRFRYRPTVQVVDFFEDSASINKYGVFEKAIRDKKITDKLAARRRGRAELRRVREVVRRVSFQTRSKWGVSVGKVHYVNTPSADFAGNCRIERVSVTFTPDDIIGQIEAQEVEF